MNAGLNLKNLQLNIGFMCSQIALDYTPSHQFPPGHNFPLSMCRPHSINAQIDVGMYNTVLYLLINYSIDFQCQAAYFVGFYV